MFINLKYKPAYHVIVSQQSKRGKQDTLIAHRHQQLQNYLSLLSFFWAHSQIYWHIWIGYWSQSKQ